MNASVPRSEYDRVVAERDRLRNRNDILELENAYLRSTQYENVYNSNIDSSRADIVERCATAMCPPRSAIEHTPRASSNDCNTVFSFAASQLSRAPRLTYIQSLLRDSKTVHSGEKRSRSKRVESKPCNAKHARTVKDSRHVNMCYVLAQVPTTQLSFLDASTQRALRAVFSSISDAQICAAQRLWRPRWMNEPFHAAREQCLRDTYYGNIVDLRVLIVCDTSSSVNFTHCVCRVDAKNSPGVSLWKTTHDGAVLQYFAIACVPGGNQCKRVPQNKHACVMLHIATLANAAHRIVARRNELCDSQNRRSHCHVLYDINRGDVRFDPSRCVTPVHFPTDPLDLLDGTWITMIIKASQARQIAELKLLRDTLPPHLQ